VKLNTQEKKVQLLGCGVGNPTKGLFGWVWNDRLYDWISSKTTELHGTGALPSISLLLGNETGEALPHILLVPPGVRPDAVTCGRCVPQSSSRRVRRSLCGHDGGRVRQSSSGRGGGHVRWSSCKRSVEPFHS
jgi:hypothetical protein